MFVFELALIVNIILKKSFSFIAFNKVNSFYKMGVECASTVINTTP